MSNRDGKGPDGKGPRTGRGAGDCKPDTKKGEWYEQKLLWVF